MGGQRKGPPPFGSAMRKLYDEIIKTEAEFNNFNSEYDGEISSIKNYTSFDILKKIWVQKVIGKKDKRTYEEDEPYTDDVDTKKPKEKFMDLKKRVEQAFETASVTTFTLALYN